MLGPQRQRRRRRQRQRVTEGTAMAPWNGPNDNKDNIPDAVIATAMAPTAGVHPLHFIMLLFTLNSPRCHCSVSTLNSVCIV